MNMRDDLNHLDFSRRVLLLFPMALASCNGKLSKSNDFDFSTNYISLEFVEVKAAANEIVGLSIFSPDGQLLFEREGGTLYKQNTVLSAGQLPNYVRVVWRKNEGWDDVPVGDSRRTDKYYREDIPLEKRQQLKWLVGSVSQDFKLSIAPRIPKAVFDALRSNSQTRLRIQITIQPNTKLTSNGISLGWSVERSLSDGRQIVDISGGDFQ